MGEKCPICLELMWCEPKKLACGHLFHITCVDEWLEIKNICPLCRQPQPIGVLPCDDAFIDKIGFLCILFIVRLFESFCYNYRRRNPHFIFDFNVDGLSNRLIRNRHLLMPYIRSMILAFVN